MGGIFSSLHTANTGLNAHQLMLDVASNNISNASDEFYSRQRVDVSPAKPLYYQDYNLGRGVDTNFITRAHDEFVFDRYKRAARDKQYYDQSFDTLREASAYFPEVQGVGIYNDLQAYFNAWKDIEKNSSNTAQKQVLVQHTQNLITNIKNIRGHLEVLQDRSSDDLKVTIEEINRMAKEIATINGSLKEMEETKRFKQANELRDQRDELEFNLSRLINANISKSTLSSYSKSDAKTVDFDEDYVLNIAGGFNIVDGGNYHPIVVSNDSKDGIHRVYFQGDDFKKTDITDKISGGKSGALLDLISTRRPNSLDRLGKLSEYINNLDAFAKGFIEASNAIYSQSATHTLQSDILDIEENEALSSTTYAIQDGGFDLIVYSADGKELLTKNIKIDKLTSMKDIITQLNSNTDDNDNNNSLDDFNNFFTAQYDNNARVFKIEAKDYRRGLSVAIKDKGSNFPGAFSINRLFEGDNANNISLKQEYINDPTSIRTWTTPTAGNFDIATSMLNLQYEPKNFNYKGSEVSLSVVEFFQLIANKIATDTSEVKIIGESKDALLEAIKKEHLAISQVSLDEEMVNLIKHQTGYAANAKVITTIDRMIETLLGIKQ